MPPHQEACVGGGAGGRNYLLSLSETLRSISTVLTLKSYNSVTKRGIVEFIKPWGGWPWQSLCKISSSWPSYPPTLLPTDWWNCAWNVFSKYWCMWKLVLSFFLQTSFRFFVVLQNRHITVAKILLQVVKVQKLTKK